MSTVITEVIPSCLNCKKVHLLAEQLIVNMQEFEVLTMEMELDPKSAKSKSREVISNYWKLFSTIKSLEIGEKHDNENKSCDNQNSPKLKFLLGVEKHQIESANEENKNQDELLESKFIPVDKKNKMRGKQQPKPALKSNPNMTSKESNELNRAKSFLRTIKCETGEGFCNLFECLQCQKQFNRSQNGLTHVRNIHLKLGIPCPTCRRKYFTKSSLALHIPKCRKNKQLKQTKIVVKKDSKRPVKVNLHPHEKPKQGNQPKNPVGKFQAQRGRPRKSLDPLKVKVEKTRNVKVKT